MVFETITQRLNIGTDEQYQTSAYIARRFNMSERSIRRNVRDYGMPAHPIGPRGVRFLVSEVQRWLDTNARKRFAATGRSVTKAELQKRIVMIPLLHGLEIVDKLQLKQDDKANLGTAKPSSNTAQGNALRPSASALNALKGQPNGSGLASDYMPRCKPGRKRTTPKKLACDASHHKWSKGRYARTCTVCGLTQERDPNDQWITST